MTAVHIRHGDMFSSGIIRRSVTESGTEGLVRATIGQRAAKPAGSLITSAPAISLRCERY